MIKKMIRDLLTSKKFVSSIAAMIAAALLRVGWDVPLETIMTVISPVIAYIIGQGFADIGKNANMSSAILVMASVPLTQLVA